MMTEQEAKPFEWANARGMFLRWEKLRPLYNAIVGLVGLAGIAPIVLSWVSPGTFPGFRASPVAAVIGVLAYAVAANVCYFVGPALECYLRWLGMTVRPLTRTLFIIGTVFSVLLTALFGLYVWGTAALAGMWAGLDW
jgi:hypothetical protein